MDDAAVTLLDDVESTMELAHAAASEGAPHGTAFIAERQRTGRGSRGRSWVSERGGLWCSVVARPSNADAFAALSLRVGLAVADVLESLIATLPTIALKWPNDLLVDGRKLAGILCEAAWSGSQCRWVVVGLGLNVRNPVPGALRREAARCLEWDHGVTVSALRGPIVAAITASAITAGPLSDQELAAYLRRDALAGRHVREPVPGEAVGVQADGSLLVRDPSGLVRPVTAGLVLDAD
jgi:BirA family biotin operon repressor/biotin-[acetyl-CoA-carboxylase] ligase